MGGGQIVRQITHLEKASRAVNSGKRKKCTQVQEPGIYRWLVCQQRSGKMQRISFALKHKDNSWKKENARKIGKGVFLLLWNGFTVKNEPWKDLLKNDYHASYCEDINRILPQKFEAARKHPTDLFPSKRRMIRDEPLNETQGSVVGFVQNVPSLTTHLYISLKIIWKSKVREFRFNISFLASSNQLVWPIK